MEKNGAIEKVMLVCFSERAKGCYLKALDQRR
jgi:hypothetical protein